MILEPYLYFDGDCAEAIAFYQRSLGARCEQVMHFTDHPHGVRPPTGSEGLVMHASLLLDGQRLMASDRLAGASTQPMQRAALALSFATVEEARRVYTAISEGGTLERALGPTFWSQAFAIVVDRHGIRWLINGPAPISTPELAPASRVRA